MMQLKIKFTHDVNKQEKMKSLLSNICSLKCNIKIDLKNEYVTAEFNNNKVINDIINFLTTFFEVEQVDIISDSLKNTINKIPDKESIEAMLEYVKTLSSFTAIDVKKHFPKLPKGTISWRLKTLNDRGVIEKISWGKYKIK